MERSFKMNVDVIAVSNGGESIVQVNIAIDIQTKIVIKTNASLLWIKLISRDYSD